VPAIVSEDVTAQRQDLESCQDQAVEEDDVRMPEASHYASAARESHERADMRDGADSGEGWVPEDRQFDTRSDRAAGGWSNWSVARRREEKMAG
jgi:hypothetical protein